MCGTQFKTTLKKQSSLVEVKARTNQPGSKPSVTFFFFSPAEQREKVYGGLQSEVEVRKTGDSLSGREGSCQDNY